MKQNQKIPKPLACPDCFRPKDTCICGRVETHDTALRIAVLQYPAEKLKLFNSAKLTSMALSNSVLRTGFSWPNLKKAVGADAVASQWAVLYLKGQNESGKIMQVQTRSGESLGDYSTLKGIIAIDGSWKQAKTLWWRNPWLNRLVRIHLNPNHRSLRGQVRKEGLSTIEAVALVLRETGESDKVYTSLIDQYRKLILDPARQWVHANPAR